MAQEILYEKTIDESTIKLIESDGVYKSLYINDSIKKGITLLEEYRYDPDSRGNGSNQNSGHWFGIMNTTIKDGTVYILYYNYGLVELKSYCFLKDDEVTMKSYFVDQQKLITYMNGGGVGFFAAMKWFNDDLFMYIRAGQKYGIGRTTSLFKYNLSIDKIKVVFAKGEIIDVKDSKNLFLTLDLDENKEDVCKYIKKVLVKNNKLRKKKGFKYLGYLDDANSFASIKFSNNRSSGVIYFFYQDTSSLWDSIKIIAYDNYDKEWIKSACSAKAIKAPNEHNIFNRK